MRPYVILNAAMTLDGKIATKTGDSKISGEKDLERVHNLRKQVDGIMIGINTLIIDDPKLTVHRIKSKKENNPIRIVVDSTGRTPINSRVLNKEAETIIAISNKTLFDTKNIEKISLLEKKATLFYSGFDKVDLKELMKYLYNTGIKTLMLEGGSTLNFSMLKEELIDEIRICIAPIVVGGKSAKTLFDGDGFNLMEEGITLTLENSYSLNKDLILEYKVIYKNI